MEQQSAVDKHNLERKCAMLEYTTYVCFMLVSLITRNLSIKRVFLLPAHFSAFAYYMVTNLLQWDILVLTGNDCNARFWI